MMRQELRLFALFIFLTVALLAANNFFIGDMGEDTSRLMRELVSHGMPQEQVDVIKEALRSTKTNVSSSVSMISFILLGANFATAFRMLKKGSQENKPSQ